jgi:hypothetical protein
MIIGIESAELDSRDLEGADMSVSSAAFVTALPDFLTRAEPTPGSESPAKQGQVAGQSKP